MATNGGAPGKKAEQQKLALVKQISEFEHQNKTLRSLIENSSPEHLVELKAKNKELKSALLQTEKDLTILILDLKTPSDAVSAAGKFQVLKEAVLGYCEERQLDPILWKKLESL